MRRTAAFSPAVLVVLLLAMGCGDTVTAPFQQIWYKDSDGDLFSDGTIHLSTSRPADYALSDDLIAVSGDCDDSSPSIHPGAPDVCNGLDDDCDATTADGTDEDSLGMACDGPDTDLCREGVTACVGGAVACTDDTDSTLDICDGLDNDCDPASADGSEDLELGAACEGEGSTRYCSAGNLVCTNPTGNGSTFVDSGQTLGNSETYSITLGDVDGDGDLDLVEGNRGPDSRVWMNDGHGIFSDSGQSLGSYTSSVALGDVDGDGDLDLVLGSSNLPTRVWLNDGNGNYTDSGKTLSSSNVDAVALGDVDGDGDLDLVEGRAGSGGGNPNRLWRNDGHGNYTDSGQDLGRYYEGYGGVYLALGDVDGDGDLDLVVGCYHESGRVWFNDGSGIYTDSGQSVGSLRTGAIVLGDLDGDGDLDLVEGNEAGQPNRVWWNDGHGVFTDSGQALGNTYTTSIALGDLDGDGDLDLAEGNREQPDRVLLNDGDGVFANSGQALGNSYTLSIALGDLDGDGDLDLVEGNWNQPNRVYLNLSR